MITKDRATHFARIVIMRAAADNIHDDVGILTAETFRGR
jgi:hypothetical protein